MPSYLWFGQRILRYGGFTVCSLGWPRQPGKKPTWTADSPRWGRYTSLLAGNPRRNPTGISSGRSSLLLAVSSPVDGLKLSPVRGLRHQPPILHCFRQLGPSHLWQFLVRGLRQPKPPETGQNGWTIVENGVCVYTRAIPRGVETTKSGGSYRSGIAITISAMNLKVQLVSGIQPTNAHNRPKQPYRGLGGLKMGSAIA